MELCTARRTPRREKRLSKGSSSSFFSAALLDGITSSTTSVSTPVAVDRFRPWAPGLKVGVVAEEAEEELC
jgi:hypothetical protein